MALSALTPSKSEPVPTSIRVALAEDRNYICDSWTRTMYRIYPNNHAIDFFPRKLLDIERHLERLTALVAHLEGSEAEIISYLVFVRRRGILVAHFGCTKDNARRQGIMAGLMAFANPERLPVAFTQPAKNENVMRHLSSKYIFDPSLWTET